MCIRDSDSGDTLYSIDIKPIYAAKGDKEASGSLLPASEVKVLKRDGDWLQIEITGWTESAGRQRVLTQFPGKRIFVASIRGDVQQQVKTLEKTTVADTNTCLLYTSIPLFVPELIYRPGSVMGNFLRICHNRYNFRHCDES